MFKKLQNGNPLSQAIVSQSNRLGFALVPFEGLPPCENSDYVLYLETSLNLRLGTQKAWEQNPAMFCADPRYSYTSPCCSLAYYHIGAFSFGTFQTSEL